MTNGPLESGILQTPVHLYDQLEHMNGVEIEHRRRPSLKTGCRIIAAHDQKVPHLCTVQRIELAFDLVAVLVLAGEMDERFDAEPQDLRAEAPGEDGRVSAGIVGNRQRVNPSAPGRPFRGRQYVLLGLLPRPPSRHQFPRDRKGLRIQQGLSETVLQCVHLNRHPPRASRP